MFSKNNINTSLKAVCFSVSGQQVVSADKERNCTRTEEFKQIEGQGKLG